MPLNNQYNIFSLHRESQEDGQTTKFEYLPDGKLTDYVYTPKDGQIPDGDTPANGQTSKQKLVGYWGCQESIVVVYAVKEYLVTMIILFTNFCYKFFLQIIVT